MNPNKMIATVLLIIPLLFTGVSYACFFGVKTFLVKQLVDLDKRVANQKALQIRLADKSTLGAEYDKGETLLKDLAKSQTSDKFRSDINQTAGIYGITISENKVLETKKISVLGKTWKTSAFQITFQADSFAANKFLSDILGRWNLASPAKISGTKVPSPSTPQTKPGDKTSDVVNWTVLLDFTFK